MYVKLEARDFPRTWTEAGCSPGPAATVYDRMNLILFK